MNNSVIKVWSQHRLQSVDPYPKPIPAASLVSSTGKPVDAQNIDTHGSKEKKAMAKNNQNKELKNSKSSKNEMLSTARLSDLGGIDACIEEVLELVAMPLAHPEIYLHTGVQPPRGILLHGPPGCGKTLLANAIAGELGVQFISISAPSVVSGMSGESEKKIRDVFKEARKKAPCLIFIDEIDAITPKRETAQREMERRIVAQLLTCMDDLSWDKTDNKPILIIGATNRPDSLDPALR
ncbi:11059_t:CDS:2, partial [Cetraspora pellucida]